MLAAPTVRVRGRQQFVANLTHSFVTFSDIDKDRSREFIHNTHPGHALLKALPVSHPITLHLERGVAAVYTEADA